MKLQKMREDWLYQAKSRVRRILNPSPMPQVRLDDAGKLMDQMVLLGGQEMKEQALNAIRAGFIEAFGETIDDENVEELMNDLLARVEKCSVQ